MTIAKKMKKFNKLTLLNRNSLRKGSNYYSEYQCECGKIKNIKTHNVESGLTWHCGCIKKKGSRTTHGQSRTKTYRNWAAMKQRCLDKNSHAYSDYGGRGITLCQEWEKFENFLIDMGEKPEGLEIDRIDNEKGYYKENCRWTSKGENLANRRVWGSTGFKGVFKHNPGFIARLYFKGKPHYLGHFKTPEQASEAYEKFKKKIYQKDII